MYFPSQISTYTAELTTRCTAGRTAECFTGQRTARRTIEDAHSRVLLHDVLLQVLLDALLGVLLDVLLQVLLDALLGVLHDVLLRVLLDALLGVLHDVRLDLVYVFVRILIGELHVHRSLTFIVRCPVSVHFDYFI